MRRAVAGLVALGVLLAGCSGGRSSAGPSASYRPVSVPASTPTPPPQLVSCPAAARAIAARTFGGRTAAPRARAVLGLTSCAYRAPAGASARAACTSVTVTVNTAAQAYVDFDRWVDEAAQNAVVPGQSGLAPHLVDAPRLGVEVDWVPAHQTLQTGRPGRWVTVAMHCASGTSALRYARQLAGTVVP